MMLDTKLSPKALEAGARAYCKFLGKNPDEFVSAEWEEFNGKIIPESVKKEVFWKLVVPEIEKAWAIKYALSAAYDVVYPSEGGKKF